jgi:hypothetical protein
MVTWCRGDSLVVIFNQIAITLACLVTIFLTPLFADTIYLKNGNKITGIITKESDKSIEIKINIGAIVTFSQEDIDRIEKDSPEARNKIEERWGIDKNQGEASGMESDIFEEEQIKKGLVKYNGKWMSAEEKERLQSSDLAKSGQRMDNDKRFLNKDDKSQRSAIARKLIAKGNWFVRESNNFNVFYRDSSQAKLIADKAEYYFEKISYDLGYEKELKWDKKCQVYIVEHIDKWKDFLKEIGYNAELVGGFVPNYTDKEMFLCAMSEAYLALTFPHELTHLILKEIAGKKNVPLWLNEGLANYEANVTSISNELLVKSIKDGKHILLGDLLSMGIYPEGKEMRELFYAQSEKLVEFLVTNYGRQKFRKFCDLILRDKSFKDILSAGYDKDFKNIEDFNIKLVEYIVK